MSATTDRIKKYVGLASNALAYALQADTAIKSQVAETEPPVGAKDEFGGRSILGATAIGGISTGTILLFAALWYFLFKK